MRVLSNCVPVVGSLGEFHIFAVVQVDSEFPGIILAQLCNIRFFLDFPDDLIPFTAVITSHTLPRQGATSQKVDENVTQGLQVIAS